jgi:hypothetical protein
MLLKRNKKYTCGIKAIGVSVLGALAARGYLFLIQRLNYKA